MKRLQGFSLMEMMIVLTIVAIVAAASAPMVNKKMVRAASEKSPWVFVSGESIGYNIDNVGGIQDRKTATIGSNGRSPQGNPRLYIDINSDTTPHILFGHNRFQLMKLIAGGNNNNLWFTNKNISDDAIASVALGWNSNAASNRSVAVGMDSDAQSNETVAIGNLAKARANVAIAIGQRAEAGFAGGLDENKFSAIAIGSHAIARRLRSIAIGRCAEATGARAIAMGSSQNDAEDNRARAQGNGSIAIGASALAQNSDTIALGSTAHATVQNAIAVGVDAQATGEDAIAIGRGSRATASGIAIGTLGPNSVLTAAGTAAIAIGDAAQATRDSSIAIGNQARATAARAIAIGNGVEATETNTIVLGDENTKVIIPGAIEFNSLHIARDLVVDYNCVVNRLGGEFIFRAQPGPPEENTIYDNSELSRIFMGDDKGGDDNTRTLRKYGWAYTILDYSITSDRRLKNVDKEFTFGLDKIKKLEVFNYTFKDDKDKTPRVGVMAQDLQKIFPDAVIKGEDGFLRIRMEDMFYAVINAVKELDIRTSNQEKRIQELEKQNAELLKRIEKLEKSK